MLDKNSPIPLHIQLTQVLREQILRKDLLPGSRLPSERELCEQYGISRITVRQALAALAQEGRVNASIGKGTFVKEAVLNEELRPLSSFSEDLARRGMQASAWVLESAVSPADDEWAARFTVPRGAEIVSLRRLRLADGLPVALQHSRLPHHLCPDLLRFDFTLRSLYDVLQREYSLRITHSTTVIEAALVQPEDAELLGLARPAAVLVSEQTTFLDSGGVIEITRSLFHAERYKLYTRS